MDLLRPETDSVRCLRVVQSSFAAELEQHSASDKLKQVRSSKVESPNTLCQSDDIANTHHFEGLSLHRTSFDVTYM